MACKTRYKQPDFEITNDDTHVEHIKKLQNLIEIQKEEIEQYKKILTTIEFAIENYKKINKQEYLLPSTKVLVGMPFVERFSIRNAVPTFAEIGTKVKKYMKFYNTDEDVAKQSDGHAPV